MPILDAIDLVCTAAGVSPGQARDWVLACVKAGAVRLQDTAGAVLRYDDTPEVQAWRAARQARSPRPARYNPLRGRMASSRPPMPPAPIDRVCGCYAVHLADLAKALEREFGIEFELAGARNALPAAARAAVDPIAIARDHGQISGWLAFFEQNGKRPSAEKMTRAQWEEEGTRAGLVAARADVDPAWQLARQRGYIVANDGAPPGARRIKVIARARAANVSKSSAT